MKNTTKNKASEKYNQEQNNIILDVEKLMLCEELKKPAEYLKNRKKVVNEMFELYQFLTDESQEKIKKQLEEAESKGIAEGEKIGMANAVINNIKSLMETMNVTAEKAMNALKIPQEEQSFYLAKLEPIS